jgi:hypothetical protein
MKTRMNMRWLIVSAGILAVSFASGCAYRYYLGMHGPSIRQHPELHQGYTQDSECLQCHHPDCDPAGPPTTHPGFTGCLKCHNDEVPSQAAIQRPPGSTGILVAKILS